MPYWARLRSPTAAAAAANYVCRCGSGCQLRVHIAGDTSAVGGGARRGGPAWRRGGEGPTCTIWVQRGSHAMSISLSRFSRYSSETCTEKSVIFIDFEETFFIHLYNGSLRGGPVSWLVVGLAAGLRTQLSAPTPTPHLLQPLPLHERRS